jgi:hypothetical protein
LALLLLLTLHNLSLFFLFFLEYFIWTDLGCELSSIEGRLAFYVLGPLTSWLPSFSSLEKRVTDPVTL